MKATPRFFTGMRLLAQADPAAVQERIKKGEKVVFGDAAQLSILQSAYVQN